jgi:acyl transferase domain-containing protein
LNQLLVFVKQNPNINLKQIASTANIRKIHEVRRVAIFASSTEELINRLESKSYEIGLVPLSPNQIGFLFSSQGCQYFGMGKNLYEVFPAFRRSLDHYESIYHKLSGKNFKSAIWEVESCYEHFYQPILLCLQMALVDLWRSFGISPVAVMGHSFGEYAAAVCAGVLTAEDAIKVSIERSRLMLQTLNTDKGSMIGVKTSEEEVESLVTQFQQSCGEREWLDVCAVNSPLEVMLTGPETTVDAFESFCQRNGLVTRINLSLIAFHSRAMDPIMAEFDSFAT